MLSSTRRTRTPHQTKIAFPTSAAATLPTTIKLHSSMMNRFKEWSQAMSSEPTWWWETSPTSTLKRNFSLRSTRLTREPITMCTCQLTGISNLIRGTLLWTFYIHSSLLTFTRRIMVAAGNSLPNRKRKFHSAMENEWKLVNWPLLRRKAPPDFNKSSVSMNYLSL